jgi:hypothetical protein
MNETKTETTRPRAYSHGAGLGLGRVECVPLVRWVPVGVGATRRSGKQIMLPKRRSAWFTPREEISSPRQSVDDLVKCHVLVPKIPKAAPDSFRRKPVNRTTTLEVSQITGV